MSFALKGEPGNDFWLQLGEGGVEDSLAFRGSVSNPLGKGIQENPVNFGHRAEKSLVFALGTQRLCFQARTELAGVKTAPLSVPYYMGLAVGGSSETLVSGFSAGIGRVSESPNPTDWQPSVYRRGGAGYWAAFSLCAALGAWDFKIWGSLCAFELDTPGFAFKTELSLDNISVSRLQVLRPFVRSAAFMYAFTPENYLFPDGKNTDPERFFKTSFAFGAENWAECRLETSLSAFRDAGLTIKSGREETGGFFKRLSSFLAPNRFDAEVKLSNEAAAERILGSTVQFKLIAGCDCDVERGQSWRIGAAAKARVGAGRTDSVGLSVFFAWDSLRRESSQKSTSDRISEFEEPFLTGVGNGVKTDASSESAYLDSARTLKITCSAKIFERWKASAALRIKEKSEIWGASFAASIEYAFEPLTGTKVSVSMTTPSGGYALGEWPPKYPDFSIAAACSVD